MNNTQEKLTGREIIELLKNSGLELEQFAFEETPCKEPYSEEALKAEQVQKQWYVDNPSPGYGKEEFKEWEQQANKYPSKYDIAKKEWKKKNNLPDWEEVEQYGGEGQGDTWYSIKYFPEHNVYLRVNGWHQSYNGTDFNGWEDCVEVKPQQKTITIYE